MTTAAQLSKARKAVIFLGVCLPVWLFLFLGLFTTPDRLIELGPMRQSLTSDIESVKSIAYASVAVFRALCVGCALLIAGAGLIWKHIRCLPIVERIHAHEAGYSSIRSSVLAPFNSSFVIICGCLVFTAVFLRWGPVWLDPGFMDRLGGEDQFIEQLQVPVLVFSCIVFLGLSIRLRGPRAYREMYGLFAFLFFLMAGEEISWGQRIFNIETPEAMKSINVQHEINLHNSMGYLADHLFMLGVLAYGFLFPVAAQVSPFVRQLFDRIGLPLPTLGLAVGFLLVSLTHHWSVGWLITEPYEFLNKDYVDELRELLTGIAFALLGVESIWLCKRTDFTDA